MRDWKSLQQELKSHLYQDHCKFTPGQHGKFTMEQLEEVHEAFHLDGHGTPHEHETTDAPYSLGAVKPKFDDDYVKQVVSIVKGEIV